MLTLENFRWNILKICSIFFLCLSWRLWTNTEFYVFCFVFFNQCNIIVSIKSWAEPLSQPGGGGAQATTRYNRQARRSLETTACSSLSHLMTTICIPDTVDLPCLFATVGCWAFYITYCTYFSKPRYFTTTRKKKTTFEAWLEAAGFSVSGCMKKDAALFNKQLHVVQSDWNYLTTNA